MATLATEDYKTPTTPSDTTDYTDETPYVSEEEYTDDEQLYKNNEISSDEEFDDYDLEEGILDEHTFRKDMKRIRDSQDAENSIYKNYPRTLKERAKLLESENCIDYEFYEQNENTGKFEYNLFKNCYLTNVDYLPNPEKTKKSIQSLNKLKKIGSKRVKTYNTLPIYLINAHSAVEPRLFLRPPKGTTHEEYLKDNQYERIGLLTDDAYKLDYAPYKYTKKYASRTDFFKTTPQSNKFVITTNPLGYDSLCGDKNQINFLKQLVIKPNLFRKAMRSEHFDTMFSSATNKNLFFDDDDDDDDDSYFKNYLYFPPGYSVLNKSFQFWDDDTNQRLYDKWGVIRLDTLNSDAIENGVFDFLDPPIKLDPKNELDSLEEEEKNKILAEKRKQIINPYCEPSIRKLIEQSIDERDDISLRKITETLGSGIYLDFSCSGMLLKMYDPSNNKFEIINSDSKDKKYLDLYKHIYSAIQESFETISRYNKLSWNNIFSRNDYDDQSGKFNNLKRDASRFTSEITEIQKASKQARIDNIKHMEGGKRKTKKNNVGNKKFNKSKKVKRKLLPKLRKLTKKNKKHIYRLKDPHKKRILAIEEGINYEHRVKRKTKKKAAIAKKGRFNILRIYRRNQTNGDCQKLTRDMRYMDKKYNLGKTKDICTQKAGKRKQKKQTKKNTKKNTKKAFLYNPDDPKKSFDVYIDKDPTDTISIKYSTVSDVKNTIKKLEKLYKTKKYTHKRIWQVGMIMKVRLQAMLKHKKSLYPNAKKVRERYSLANKYFKFLGRRTQLKTFKERKALTFNI